MARLLRMPEVAANTVEAVLSAWPIAENTPFAADFAIAMVETDKAVVDIPAETNGVILKTLVAPGSTVRVGDPIAVLGEPGETITDLDALLAKLAPESPAIVNELTPQSAEGASPEVSDGRGDRIFSSPLARKLAREAGLSFADLSGSGPGGRIVRRDVQRAKAMARKNRAVDSATTADSLPDAAPPSQPSLPLSSQSLSGAVADSVMPGNHEEREPSVTSGASVDSGPSAVAGASGLAYLDVPHSRMRRTIAARLTQSTREAPHFTVHGGARVDKLLRLRAKLNETGPVKISINDLVVTAAARAHVVVPAMNVIWLPDAVRQFSSVDVSVAVATERGLVTPVLRGVDRMTVSTVATATSDVVARARSGHLRQEELEGGTLTVTNLGVFGTEDFSAIINPPQSAILAVGAARQEPLVRKGKVSVGTILKVTLSVDHRPVDGAVAAQWMAAFLAFLETPLRILA